MKPSSDNHPHHSRFQVFRGYAQTNLVSEAMRSYRYREALELLERAPESVENQLLKAECYQRLNDFPTALRLYESLTSGKHESVGILTAAAGIVLHRAGEMNPSQLDCLKARELRLTTST